MICTIKTPSLFTLSPPNYWWKKQVKLRDIENAGNLIRIITPDSLMLRLIPLSSKSHFFKQIFRALFFVMCRYYCTKNFTLDRYSVRMKRQTLLLTNAEFIILYLCIYQGLSITDTAKLTKREPSAITQLIIDLKMQLTVG